MYVKKVVGIRTVRLPNGNTISHADLPCPSTRRWVASRKAAVVRAVIYGLLTKAEAVETYNLTEDEFENWLSAMAEYGKQGLKVTRCQEFRRENLAG